MIVLIKGGLYYNCILWWYIGRYYSLLMPIK